LHNLHLESQVTRFLVEVHRLIDEVAKDSSATILARLDAAQPNERLEELEHELVQVCRAVVFHALGLMDGVGDPSLTREPWVGLQFEHRSDGSPMLHDAFMDALSTYEGLPPARG
jgi:hypothetical protein